MDRFVRGMYGLLGALAVLSGAAVLAAPSLVARPEDPPIVSHLLREEASLFVFVGLMFFWARRHFSQRRSVHLALLVFTVLFAGVHWADYLKGGHWRYALFNTVPVVILLLTMPRRDVRTPARASL